MRILLKPELNKYEWHKWFAWYPVIVKNDSGPDIFIWLEYVERKLVVAYRGVDAYFRKSDGSDLAS